MEPCLVTLTDPKRHRAGSSGFVIKSYYAAPQPVLRSFTTQIKNKIHENMKNVVI